MENIGAHVSVAGGLYKGLEKAKLIGAHTIQIFGASPRQWAAIMPSDESIKKFKSLLKPNGVNSVFLHAAYLVNLGTPDNIHWEKSIKSLCDHLQIAKLIGAEGLIFHVGTTYGEDREYSLNRAIIAMKKVLKMVPGKTNLIMENSAGGKSKIGSTIDDLAFIFKKLRSSRIKICIDTAHALEAGIIKDYSPLHIKEFFDELSLKIGIDQLSVLHVNDSKTPFNSHHDRHENIGSGHIGLEGFRNLAKDKRIRTKPWILEVPGFDTLGPDKKNIQLLNSCFGTK